MYDTYRIQFTCCIQTVEAAKDRDVTVQFELTSAELPISKDSVAGVMKLVTAGWTKLLLLRNFLALDEYKEYI